MVRSFIPAKPDPGGHILLTTRTRATGAIAQPIEVDKMDEHEGTLLLLRRAGISGSDKQPDQVPEEIATIAHTIVTALAGLPLALDQAGGHIEETGCTLSDYQQLYQQHRQELLNWRSQLSPDYPATVATTWSLAFQRIEQANPAAAALLQFCAFLAPDAIPEDIIRQIPDATGTALGVIVNDSFKLNTALEILRRYSLVQRNAETQTLTLHRLVQVVLQDSVPQEMQMREAERVINTLHRCFLRELDRQLLLEHYLPQAYVCLELIDRYSLILPLPVELLLNVGSHLYTYARYREAEVFYQKVIDIYEKLYGNDSFSIALLFYRIGQLYYFQDRFKEAEEFYQRALAIYLSWQGVEYDMAWVFDGLGQLYHRQGLYLQGEEAYKKALSYYDKVPIEFAKSEITILLHRLATLHTEQGNYLQAEEDFKRVVLAAKDELLLIPDTSMLTGLDILIMLYQDRNEHEKIEKLYLDRLENTQKKYGLEHPTTAALLHELGWYRRGQGRYDEAEEFYQLALSIREKMLGIEHADTAMTIHYLAKLKLEQGKAEEAKSLYHKALNIKDKVLGDKHISTGATLHELARIYEDMNMNDEAEQFYLRTLDIYEKVLGTEHADNALVLHEIARVYITQSKYEDAERCYKRALAISEKTLGSEHQNTAATLHQLALLYQLQKKYDQSEIFYQRTLNIKEKVLGLEHSLTIRTAKEYAALLRALSREDEALEVEARIEQR